MHVCSKEKIIDEIKKDMEINNKETYLLTNVMNIMKGNVDDIRQDIKEIKSILLEELPKRYVSKNEFEPFRKGFYWIITIIVGAVLITLLTKIGLQA